MNNVIRKFLEWTAHTVGAPLSEGVSLGAGANIGRTESLWFAALVPAWGKAAPTPRTRCMVGAKLALAFAVAAAWGSKPVFAGTQAEYRDLQQWCVGRDKWMAEGSKTDYPNPPEYFHFQHYCSALRAMKSLYSATSQEKMRYASGLVINESDYVISHVPESHTMMPEVYALRGKAMAIVKQNASAETNLAKALQLDPKHVGAYATLANHYLDTKRRAKAEETVKMGLSVDPQHKALRRMAADLGIKVEAPKPEEVVTNSATQPAASVEAPAVQAVPAGAPPPEPPKIGSPTNPWCRFCPDPVVKP